MQRNYLKNHLENLGFKPADQVTVLNYVVPYTDYMYRVHNNQHQYVWSVTYDDKVVEIVVEVFLAPRNSKAKITSDITDQEKRGARTLHCSIARDLETLTNTLDKTYPDFKTRFPNE